MTSSGDAIEGSGPAEEPTPAANLWEAWDRWAAIVETIVLCPEKRQLVTRRLYDKVLQGIDRGLPGEGRDGLAARSGTSTGSSRASSRRG